jgi:iron(III) transport system ATP-binding protein
MIEVRGVSKAYQGKPAVAAVDLELAPGRITCLLGPSGCGKSTLLRLIAGLETPDAGSILADGQDMTRLPPERRDIGLVFQDYALFPHLTVQDNVAFGLAALPSTERRSRALALLERVKLASRASAWPGELSGGEQQRVALVRALAREPRAVLLDEPFSGLDAHLKGEVRDAALAALRASGAAVLIVTHDAEEAMLMADDLALMAEGRILQRGSPQHCYLEPVSIGAARLLGDTEVLPARITGGVAETPFGDLPASGLPNGAAQVMVRPEAFVLGEGVEAEVTDVRFIGQGWRASLIAGGTAVRARLASEPDERVRVRIDPARGRVFAQIESGRAPGDAAAPDP